MEFNRNPESAKTLRAHIPLLVGLVAPRHPPWNMAAAGPGVIYFLLTSTHVKMVGRFNARDPLAGIVATWVFKLCCPRVKHLANFCLMLYRCSNFALMAPVPVCKKTWAGSNGFWLVRRKSCKVPPTQHRPRRLKRPQKVLPPPISTNMSASTHVGLWEDIMVPQGWQTHPKGSISRSRQVWSMKITPRVRRTFSRYDIMTSTGDPSD